MKLTAFILSIFLLSACNNRTGKDIVDEMNKTIDVDNLSIDSAKIFETAELYKEIYNCNFEEFISDKNTPKLAKDIYLDNEWNLSKDTEALALLDSLTAKNKQTRPFYFKVVTKTYKKTDGYFSEGLGLIGKEYVENNTKEFLSYFSNVECFTDMDLETWSNIVMLEFSMFGVELETNNIVQDYIKTLKANCNDSKNILKRTLNKFCDCLMEKRQKLLNEINQNIKIDKKPNR